MKIQLNQNEKHGWWKRVVPDRWTYRAKARAKVNEQPAMILWDSGAEVSLISSSFAHELGVVVDTTRAVVCEGVGGVRYETEGMCTVKMTLANELAYELTLLVGSMEGQDLILGLDFMARAGVRLDAADGSVCLPDDVYVRFEGRKQLFNSHARPLYPESTRILQPGEYCDVAVRHSQGQELWIKRGKSWITTILKSRGGIPRSIRVTNVSEEQITLSTLDQVGVWMSKGFVPRKPGFIREGSRRSVEWKNLAYSATTDEEGSSGSGVEAGPSVEKTSYITPTAILKRNPDRTTTKPAVNTVQRVDPGVRDGQVKPTLRILQVQHARDLDLSQDGAVDEVVVYESEDPTVEDLEGGFAIIPEVNVSPIGSVNPLTKESLKVGDLVFSSAEDLDRLKDIIWSRKQILMGKGDAMPPAARGVICDIDVGDAKPIAQSVRKVRPEYIEKLFELIKGLLSNGLIVPSKSPWASPIVIVLKKNGDIRLCIDYRMVNALTRLMVYPMPLVAELLENLDKMMWYCSLDMASGFWVVSMTARARLISAFITPFGLFEWTRMPFGLKNAPQIYQRIVDNVVYNTFRISNEGGSEEYDVFEGGIPTDPSEESLMKRRSYIDDFLIPSTSWEGLCEIVAKFLDACVYWNLSISVDKSVWGMPMVEYLGHKIDRIGIHANPKNPEALKDLKFPTSLRAMQSFLGSVNYYSRFVNDYATIAAVLYEWKPGSRSTDDGENREAQRKAEYAFELLKMRIGTTPRLKHFDPELEPVIAVYATRWSISGALLQKTDQGYEPIRFTSRVLKKHEKNYSPAEKEILALLRVLDICFTMLAGKKIRVLTSCSTLGWLWKVKGLQGRLAIWAAMLSGWTLEVQRSAESVQDFLGVVAAGSAPPEHMNEVLEELSPLSVKGRGRVPAPIPVLPAKTNVVVASFDGSARSKRQGGSCSAVLWKFPEWTVIRAASRYFDDITVNEAEYQGIRLAFELAGDLGVEELVICGDSKLVIKQLRGEMECRAAGLQLLWREASKDLGRVRWCELVHVKREWNAAADLLATKALQAQVGVQSADAETARGMEILNRLNEVILVSGRHDEEEPGATVAPQVAAVITREQRTRLTPDPEDIAGLRVERVRIAQGEEEWIKETRSFLNGDLASLDQGKIQRYAKVADYFEIDKDDLLRYISHGRRQADGSSTVVARLVIPTTLVRDVLHHFHSSVEGGHQGVGRTYAKAKRSCYWRSMYKDVQGYVASCTDCQTGKGRPGIQAASPGNVEATYPFQIIAMDHVPSMPRSHRGNTELLLWVDLFSGYVIAKANDSRRAPVVAEAYEECVFRRFGASEYIRHDREPGFMAEFFEAFNKLMGQRQRATMAYRPQANGSAERMVQTLTRAIRMYVEDEGQRDWDDYAERLVFALNTSHDRVRDETPFYLVHGWDPKTTLESTLLCGSEEERDRDPRQWRFRIQRQFMYARRHAEQLLREAQADRVERSVQRATTHSIEVGSRVWLYIERVKEGLARKLAHKWHGPFRVVEMKDPVMCKLDVTGSGYRVSPWVHVSRLKLFREAPLRPTTVLNVDPSVRFDFEEALLPEDSYEPDPEAGMFEVEELLEREVVRPRTRNGRSYVKYLVKWKGYEEPSWVEERDLNCGGLIYDFNQRMRGLQRFQMMQTAEDPPRADPTDRPRD